MIPQIVGGAVIVRGACRNRLHHLGVSGGCIDVGIRRVWWNASHHVGPGDQSCLLIGASLILVVLAWIPFGFHVPTFMKAVVNSPMVQARVAEMAAGASLSGDALGWRFLEPGLFLTKPLELFSLGLALVLGTAAMPHVLMRFFTVRDATAARHSVLWAMFGIGLCHLCIIVIGFAAAYYVGAGKIMLTDKGGNLAAPLLAQTLSGGASSVAGDLMLAFVGCGGVCHDRCGDCWTHLGGCVLPRPRRLRGGLAVR